MPGTSKKIDKGGERVSRLRTPRDMGVGSDRWMVVRVASLILTDAVFCIMLF